MTTHREERASCTMEAGAVDLHDGHHWKPWLRLIRRNGRPDSSQTFDGLKPVFGSRDAALRYAVELGRRLADEGWHLDSGAPSAPDAGMPARLSKFAAQAGRAAEPDERKLLRSPLFLSLAVPR